MTIKLSDIYPGSASAEAELVTSVSARREIISLFMFKTMLDRLEK